MTDAIAELMAERDALRAQVAELELDAARAKWHREHPLWRVLRRQKPDRPIQYRLQDDEGMWWGSWWPTHEQTIDAAIKQMAQSAAIAAQEQK